MTNLCWTILAQADDFGRPEFGPGDAAGAAAGIGVILGALLIPVLIAAALFVVMLIGQIKVFTKAGKPWWSAIVPVYNMIVLAEIVGRPQWWGIVAALVPCVNIVFVWIMFIDLAKSFGKETGFGILLILFPYVGIPLLGFGDAKYVGPSVQPA